MTPREGVLILISFLAPGTAVGLQEPIVRRRHAQRAQRIREILPEGGAAISGRAL